MRVWRAVSCAPSTIDNLRKVLRESSPFLWCEDVSQFLRWCVGVLHPQIAPVTAWSTSDADIGAEITDAHHTVCRRVELTRRWKSATPHETTAHFVRRIDHILRR
jgi:hypothetical protein